MTGPLKDWRSIAQSYERYINQIEHTTARLRVANERLEREVAACRAELERLRGRLGSAASFGDVLSPDAVRSILDDAPPIRGGSS